MSFELEFCCELPDGVEEDIDAFVGWLRKHYPLKRRCRYVMEIWAIMNGVCEERTEKGIYAIVYCPYAEKLLAKTRLSVLATVAHEYKHILQHDQNKALNERGVENWALARIREAQREGVI